ncbi:PP2A regulatory subunit TAP46 [Sorghum bicolor]|uniref:PP2A regulatory subunit TAP46 n=1 Tax=Sorghum bicolor TaxID=4558 RepID=UPI000B4246D6|nr:PP2A regulatory subunit TAP46 [Sorghum bicolor]|eukprot:XP_021311981.1 PP2A regulatory subunit TAP46 [Sorghum bicolor]
MGHETLESIASSDRFLGSLQALSLTTTLRTELLVARFKCQKAAETKLQEIRESKERCGRSLRAAALSAPIEAGEEDDLEDDGEEEREAWLATISLALCKAFDLLDMLKKEEEMLLAVKERKAKVWYDHLAVVLPLRDATLETSSGVNILFVLTSSARTYT